MAQLEGYTALIREVHHVNKLDAPSGTAITLKQTAMAGGLPEDTPIRSERQGEVVGLHALAWDSVHDSVVLQHEAKNRGGFAEGAVLALRWTWQQHLQGHHGLFTMTDLFKP
jgi:4-hydroxy-tetrahydrodipicolinate reductase